MIPDRGDILHLDWDPAAGHEMKGQHFGLVVSSKAFNQRMSLALVCPISGGAAEKARSGGLLVSLMGTGMRTDGNVHVHLGKFTDWNARHAVFVEKAPDDIVEQVQNILSAIIED